LSDIIEVAASTMAIDASSRVRGFDARTEAVSFDDVAGPRSAEISSSSSSS